MPSRKKSYRKTSKRGSRRRGRKATKRSLRFTPKFVITERSNTIEDTLNSTIMGRDTFRIPEDVANIIQGYEGAETLYFNVDPILNEFSFSTTNSLKDGGKTYIKSNNKLLNGDPLTYFIRVIIQIPYMYGLTPRKTSRSVLLAVIASAESTNIEDISVEHVLIKYYSQFVSDLKNSFTGDTKYKGPSSIPKTSSKVERIIPYPFEVEDYHNEIIFDKAI